MTTNLQTIASNYHSLIVGIVVKQLVKFRRQQDTDDCVQSTYLRLAEGALDKYDADKGSLSTWIGMVAYQTTMDHLRGAKHRLTVAGDDQATAVADHTPNAESLLAGRMDSERLQQALTTLTDAERTLLDRLLAGEANKSIGAELGIPAGTVAVRKLRIVGKLRDMLSERTE